MTPPSPGPVPNGHRVESLEADRTQHDKRIVALEVGQARLEERMGAGFKALDDKFDSFGKQLDALGETVGKVLDEHRPPAARDRATLWLQVATVLLLAVTLVWRLWPHASTVAQAATVLHR